MSGESGFTIRFDIPVDDPEAGVMYAGRTPDGALAFAPTLESAEIWGTEKIAGRFLENGYGPNMRTVGRVVEVVDGVEVAS